MEYTFKINLLSRNVLLKFLENHTLEQLNKVPDGFSNNLIWNIGHIVVVQQMLVYRLSGLPMMVSDAMVAKYMKGTKPEADVTLEEVEEIKSLLFATLEQSKKDFADDIFKTYNEFTTSAGYTVTSVKDAMEFNNYHEGMHTGIMMQIKKFI
ncbi:DinB family protein [Flavobacterium amniphilum]|uniref:DinB family protein n=1 Tax=Flavobacterium amniphilum TaxID=1834035 RepID=UPI002029BCB1|nr:DinB family protein [Flavobacterium amniphilum]MCL9805956.1 DinB family protein [Flavobacterium amniphilum]